MRNKEILQRVSERTGIEIKILENIENDFYSMLYDVLSDPLCFNGKLTIKNFGAFEFLTNRAKNTVSKNSEESEVQQIYNELCNKSEK